jgi:6-phosphogluconolactonase
MPTPIYKPTIMEFENLDMLYRQVSDILEDKINLTSLNKGVVRLLLSGGSSPLPMYKRLGQSRLINWEDVELFITDERYLSETEPASNKKNIIENLGLDVVNSLKESYFYNTTLPIEKAVESYNDVIDSLDGVFFDQAILGIGLDGHFASLFPNSEYLRHLEDEIYVIQTQNNTNADIKERISLSVETILNSEEIFIILTGEKKQAILTELLEGTKSVTEFPAKFLLSHPKVTIFCSFF